MINGHGDDAYRYNTPIRADFSSNVWYGGPDPDLLACLREKITTVGHYPDAGAEGLQGVIAESIQLPPGQVLVTNGATEAIYLLAQAFRGQSAIIFTPAFAEYEDACRIHGLEIQRCPWERLGTGSAPDPSPAAASASDAEALHIPAALAFICNPNNPTGAALSLERLLQLLEANPDCCFVIDESYIEFTKATESLLPFLSGHPNLVLLRSLTKSCAIPGLRIGYVLGDSRMIEILRQNKMPWSVNRLAIEAGLYIFSHRDRFILPLAALLTETAVWRQELQEATGWTILPTSTHYFLVETNGIRAADLKTWLVKEHGLLIRDAANFHGLTPAHLRVACQKPGDNRLLTHALKECTLTGLS